MDRMKSTMQPLFTDVTWGAGGSTATLTMQLCQYAHNHGHVAGLHLTCTNVSNADPVDAMYQALSEAHASGIRNIVALRGDPALGQTEWKAADGGFTCALDLVEYIRKQSFGADFGIAVAGYPEGHPNAISEIDDPTTLTATEQVRSSMFNGKWYCCKDEDYQKELDYLQRKVNAGAGTKIHYQKSIVVIVVVSHTCHTLLSPLSIRFHYYSNVL
jgi:methylenetetrahydrofolate reductase (NADPH)